MKKIIISICLIIIFFLIFFSYNTYENFNFSVNKTKYIPQYVGPILFYDYNDNKIGSYPDDKIWPDLFKKKDNKYINLFGAGKPFDIKFPKAKKGSVGVKGYKGLNGDIGPPGIKGLPVTGRKGDKGDKGDRGDRGETGGCNVCNKGDKGDKGNKGEKGDKGDQGDQGDRPLKKEAEIGIKGEKGDMGPIGTLKGDTGNLGQKGPKGDKGLPGNVLAIKGAPGHLNPIINDDYLQINRQDNINSPRKITIGNNRSTINIDTNTVYINKNFCIEKNGIELCINKDDIKRLYEFNNPICICPNGIVANKDKCAHNGIISCNTCGDNYYLKNIRINARWKKNISTNICESCASASSCLGGQYLSGCGSGKMGVCVPCPACPRGQHRVNCNKTSTGTCVNNVCKCNNGTAATGSDCTSNRANICQSCNNGYYKYESQCKECQGCPVGHHRVGCNGESAGKCVENVCKCNNGTAAKGTECPKHDHLKCTSCIENHYKNGDTCVP